MTADNQSNERDIDIKGNADGSTLVTGDRNNIYKGPVDQSSNVMESLRAANGLTSQLTTPFFFPDTLVGEVFVGRENELKSPRIDCARHRNTSMVRSTRFTVRNVS